MVVATLSSSISLHGAEPKMQVNDRLSELVAWADAGDEEAIEHLIDCLADDRVIDGGALEGEVKNVWSKLRSRTNGEIPVSSFALHQLCQRPNSAKAALARRIEEHQKDSKADPAADWSTPDGYPAFRLLHALAEVHSSELLRQGTIPKTQVLIEIKNESKTAFISSRTGITLVVGYLDHRDDKFSEFVSGKSSEGDNEIETTRRNIVDLANAIRDSNFKESKQR